MSRSKSGRPRSRARPLPLRERAARRARRQSVSSGRLRDLAEWLAADDEAFEIALRSWHAAGHRGPEPRTAFAARRRPRRSSERLRPRPGSRRAPTPLIVELAANAPAAMLAAVQAAIEAVAPLVAVELVRVPSWASDEQLRLRGPTIASRDEPISAGRRQARAGRAMAAFAAALDAALAVAGDGGGRS